MLTPAAGRWGETLVQHTKSIFSAFKTCALSGSNIGNATCAAYLTSWMRLYKAGFISIAPELLLATGLLLQFARSVLVLQNSKRLRVVNESSY